MTNEELIAKIKAEIERLKTFYGEPHTDFVCETLLSFLSTLESEKPMNQDGLEEELDKWRHDHFHGKRDDHFSGEYLERTSQLDLARHFAQWGAEHLTDARKMKGGSSEIPNDLEEAAEEYADKHGFRVPYDGSDNFYDDVDVKASKEGFIAGAKWQKEQMMKEAVEGRVFMSFVPGHNQMVMADVDLPTNTNVRVIVLPKEEEKTTTKSSEDTEFWPLHRPWPLPEPDADDSYYENNW